MKKVCVIVIVISLKKLIYVLNTFHYIYFRYFLNGFGHHRLVAKACLAEKLLGS